MAVHKSAAQMKDAEDKEKKRQHRKRNWIRKQRRGTAHALCTEEKEEEEGSDRRDVKDELLEDEIERLAWCSLRRRFARPGVVTAGLGIIRFA